MNHIRLVRMGLGYCCAAAICILAPGAMAAAPEAPRTLEDNVRLVRVWPRLAFPFPTALRQAPAGGDGAGPMALLTRAGVIHMFPPEKTSTPEEVEVFADFSDRVILGSNAGALDLEFSPRFPDFPAVYVLYSTRFEDDSVAVRVSRFLSGAVETVLMEIPMLSTDHHGGSLLFGPDGYLYISIGDGRDDYDSANLAQDLTQLPGSVLRIDVEGTFTRPDGYDIPAGNPFVEMMIEDESVRGEIYAYGLRNPYRMAFSPDGHHLYCGDVGKDSREEINMIVAGGNFGWPIREGSICIPAGPPTCRLGGLEPPLLEYLHGGLPAAVVLGGIQDSPRASALRGLLVFSDAEIGEYYAVAVEAGKASETVRISPRVPGIVPAGWGRDAEGELYVLNFAATGGIYRLQDRDDAAATGWLLE